MPNVHLDPAQHCRAATPGKRITIEIEASADGLAMVDCSADVADLVERGNSGDADQVDALALHLLLACLKLERRFGSTPCGRAH